MKEATRKTAILLFVVRFLKLFISILTLSVSAKYFGVGMDREVWLLSFNFITVLNLAICGSLNETFRARFIFLRTKEGEKSALESASSLFIFTLAVLFAIIVLIEIFPLQVAKIIAPSYPASSLGYLSVMLRFLLASMLINQATLFLSSILNTYNSFYTPEITGFFSALINLVLIVVLSNYIGIYSLVVSTYVSLILLLLVLLYQVRRYNIRLFGGRITLSWKRVKPFVVFSLPFFLPYLIGQANGLIEKMISTVIGNNAVAIIDYSRKIPEVVISVLTSVLATIMVPVIASRFAEKNLYAVKTESKKYFQMVLLLLAVVVPLLTINSDDISNILYNKGNITSVELTKISTLIVAYSVCLISILMYLISGLILMSTGCSKQYALYGVLTQILMIVLNVLLFRRAGVYTFVFSTVISHTIAAILMLSKLPFAKRDVIVMIVKYLSLLILIIVAALCFKMFIHWPFNSYLKVVINSSIVMIMILVFFMLFKLDEMKTLKHMVFVNFTKRNNGNKE